LQNVPGRFELIDEGQDFAVVVDYAHTPDALSALLDTVRDVGAKRVITVFGCGGERDQTKRAYMGELAHFKSDIVILTNDNPRREAPEKIIQDIVAGFPPEVTEAYPGSVYNYLSDIGRVHEVRIRVWPCDAAS
jgi:UDP-N-acetylmuramyl tripeptide synthase